MGEPPWGSTKNQVTGGPGEAFLQVQPELTHSLVNVTFLILICWFVLHDDLRKGMQGPLGSSRVQPRWISGRYFSDWKVSQHADRRHRGFFFRLNGFAFDK